MYHKYTLSNNLRVVLTPLSQLKSATAIVFVGAGSRYENKNNNGISHFLEHMAFKGTVKRPNAFEISSIVDGIGGEFNAFTSKENTGYYIKASSSHLKLVLDVLADMTQNSKFEVAEIEKERGVIIEEINMYEDSPQRKVSEVYESLVWGDQPLGWDISGNKEVIRKLKRSEFLDYFGKHYRPNNIVISIAGNLEKQETLELVRDYFGKMKTEKVPQFLKVKENQTKPKVDVKYKKTDQAHLCLGARTFRFDHPDRFKLGVLNAILGGGMSSRLFINVRERRGLAYYIHSSIESYQDTGTLVAQAGADLARIEDCVKVILEELAKISSSKIEENELNKAKQYIKGRITLELEDTRNVAWNFGSQELLEKRIRTPEEIFKEVDKVSATDLQKLSQDLFVNNKLNLAVIGPFKERNKFERIFKL